MPTSAGRAPHQSAGPNRAARGAITRDQIIATATRMITQGHFDDLTVRAIAEEMGVAPMSLYRHVRNKDDLLDEVVDNLLQELSLPRIPFARWRRYLTASATAFRNFLVEQPAALHVYLSHPVVSPAAVTRMEAMLRALREAGCPDQEATRAYATIHTYTVGFAALETTREAFVAPADAELTNRLAAFTTPAQFETGLTFILDGIAAQGAARRVRADP
jgi:AcrR family transcriptional regulator